MAETKSQDIYSRMVAIMRDIPAIEKDSKNQQQGFNYRGIDQVYNTLQPILAKHGVFTVSEVIDSKVSERKSSSGRPIYHCVVRMKVTFVSADASSVSSIVYGEGMDSGDKAYNKAMSIAMKYAMFQTFLIPTASVDPDSESPDHGVAAGSHSDAKTAPKAAVDEKQVHDSVLPEDRKALVMALSGGVKRKLITASQRDEALVKGNGIMESNRFNKYLGSVLGNLDKIAREIGDTPADDEVPERDVSDYGDAHEEGDSSTTEEIF